MTDYVVEGEKHDYEAVVTLSADAILKLAGNKAVRPTLWSLIVEMGLVDRFCTTCKGSGDCQRCGGSGERSGGYCNGDIYSCPKNCDTCGGDGLDTIDRKKVRLDTNIKNHISYIESAERSAVHRHTSFEREEHELAGQIAAERLVLSNLRAARRKLDEAPT